MNSTWRVTFVTPLSFAHTNNSLLTLLITPPGTHQIHFTCPRPFLFILILCMFSHIILHFHSFHSSFAFPILFLKHLFVLFRPAFSTWLKFPSLYRRPLPALLMRSARSKDAPRSAKTWAHIYKHDKSTWPIFMGSPRKHVRENTMNIGRGLYTLQITEVMGVTGAKKKKSFEMYD